LEGRELLKNFSKIFCEKAQAFYFRKEFLNGKSFPQAKKQMGNHFRMQKTICIFLM